MGVGLFSLKWVKVDASSNFKIFQIGDVVVTTIMFKNSYWFKSYMKP